MRGLYALDDLIGRRFEVASQGAWLDHDPPAVGLHRPAAGRSGRERRAGHGGLFLQPTSALFWNTYCRREPWSGYGMDIGRPTSLSRR